MGTQECSSQKPLSDTPSTAPPHQEYHGFPHHPYLSHTICCLGKTPALWLTQYTKGDLAVPQFHVNFWCNDRLLYASAVAIHLTLWRIAYCLYNWTSFTHRVCCLNRPSLALAASHVAVKDSFVCPLLLIVCPQWTLTLSHQRQCAGTVNTTRGRAKWVMMMRTMHKGNSSFL